MKKLFAVLVFLALTGPAMKTQETPPTKEICRANLAAWSSDLDPDNWGTLSRNDLKHRTIQMDLCSVIFKVEQNAKEALPYALAARNYGLVAEYRYQRFLKRHNLQQQFVDEDDAGQR